MNSLRSSVPRISHKMGSAAKALTASFRDAGVTEGFECESDYFALIYQDAPRPSQIPTQDQLIGGSKRPPDATFF